MHTIMYTPHYILRENKITHTCEFFMPFDQSPNKEVQYKFSFNDTLKNTVFYKMVNRVKTIKDSYIVEGYF